MLVKAKCINCMETLGDYDPLFKIPDNILKIIIKHTSKGHLLFMINHKKCGEQFQVSSFSDWTISTIREGEVLDVK